MGRLVAPRNRAEASLASSGDTTKNYLETIAKHIPGEILSAYVALNTAIATVADSFQNALWIISFVLCLILTPVYLVTVYRNDDPKPQVLHLVMSTVAFIIWAYAVGKTSGVFGSTLLSWYDAGLASVMMIIFTLISGFIRPQSE